MLNQLIINAMKIEIQNSDPSGQYGYIVYDLTKNRPIENMNNTLFIKHWDEDQIYNLLGGANYSKFEKGKYLFDICKEDIFCASSNYDYYTKKCLNNFYLKKQASFSTN